MGTDQADIDKLLAAGPPDWVAAALPSEVPAHDVTLTRGYWIDTTEVTNAVFEAFKDAGGYTTESYWSPEGWAWVTDRVVAGLPKPCEGDAPDVPRRCITWFEAEAYAAWRGGRLPTEAEWEYAARGPKASVYPWGDEWDPTKANVVDSTGPAAVGMHPTGVSWVGAQDMSGNAMEWVSDWLAPPIRDAPATDPDRARRGHDQGREGRLVGQQPVRRPVRLPPLRGSADLQRRAHRLPRGLRRPRRSAAPTRSAPTAGRRVPRPGDPDGVGTLRRGLPASRGLDRLAPAGRHEPGREIGQRREHEQPPRGVAMRDLEQPGRPGGIDVGIDGPRLRRPLDGEPGATEHQQVEVQLARPPSPPPLTAELALDVLEPGEELEGRRSPDPGRAGHVERDDRVAEVGLVGVAPRCRAYSRETPRSRAPGRPASAPTAAASVASASPTLAPRPMYARTRRAATVASLVTARLGRCDPVAVRILHPVPGATAGPLESLGRGGPGEARRTAPARVRRRGRDRRPDRQLAARRYTVRPRGSGTSSAPSGPTGWSSWARARSRSRPGATGATSSTPRGADAGGRSRTTASRPTSSRSRRDRGARRHPRPDLGDNALPRWLAEVAGLVASTTSGAAGGSASTSTARSTSS